MTRGRFARERLPDPVEYFTAVAGLRLWGRGQWRSAICPFHDDERPSLRLHVETGRWRCMACGARGRDIIDFERMRSGAAFVDAVKRLGAWQ